jgi:hypothetical protein
MKLLLILFFLVIESFGYTQDDIDFLRESVAKTKFPTKTDGGLTLTNIKVSDNGVVTFLSSINSKQFYKDSGVKPTKESISKIKDSVLNQYKAKQIVGLCSSHDTRLALDLGINFVYRIDFDNGLYFGETKITKGNCQGIKGR